MTEEYKKINKPEAPQPMLNFLLLSAGSIFTSMLIAGFIVGYGIDQLFDTTPIFMLLCGVLGFVGGSQKVQKLLTSMDKQAAKNKAEAEEKAKK